MAQKGHEVCGERRTGTAVGGVWVWGGGPCGAVVVVLVGERGLSVGERGLSVGERGLAGDGRRCGSGECCA